MSSDGKKSLKSSEAVCRGVSTLSAEWKEGELALNVMHVAVVTSERIVMTAMRHATNGIYLLIFLLLIFLVLILLLIILVFTTPRLSTEAREGSGAG
jgi:hypothetical protein